MPTTESRRYQQTLIVLMVLAVAVRVCYMLYTHRTWEDAMIAATHARNAALGLGLSATVLPGRPHVQGYSSPLGVLIPLLGEWIHRGSGLLALKLASIIAAPLAVWMAAKLSRLVGVPEAVALLPAAYVALEFHQVMFGMAGMETQLVTLLDLTALVLLFRGPAWALGVVLGLAMLARPDALFLLAIALGYTAWRSRAAEARRALLTACAACAAVYLPWVAFATAYYGSPVPNTVVAKALGYPPVWQQMHRMGLRPVQFALHVRLLPVFQPLGPSYAGNGTGFVDIRDHNLVAYAVLLLVLLSGAIAVRRRHAEAIVVFGFVLIYGIYLCAFTPVIFAWYGVPVAAVAVISASYGLWGLARRLPTKTRTPGVAALATAYVAVLVACLPFAFRSDRSLRHFIEDGVRKPAGLFLANAASPDDVIASESLGYFGYYSGRVIDDYPGLSSPEVIRYLREHPDSRNMPGMMHALRPRLLVLRPLEYRGNRAFAWLNGEYEQIGSFQAEQGWSKAVRMPDRNLDYAYDVFRRKSAAEETQH